MPVIGEKAYKQINLPTAGAWVKILTNPNSDAWKEVQDEPDNEKAAEIMLSKIIVEWNFTDAEGNPAGITLDNIKKALSSFDLAKISMELGLRELILSDAKKNSSTSISSAKETTNPPQNI